MRQVSYLEAANQPDPALDALCGTGKDGGLPIQSMLVGLYTIPGYHAAALW